jgi:hypothetical protein
MMTQIFSERMALIVVTIIGMTLCSAGIGQIATRGDWLHPIAILGYLFGTLILCIVGATLLGIKLPLITTERAALIAVILIGIVKIMLIQVYRFARPVGT